MTYFQVKRFGRAKQWREFENNRLQLELLRTASAADRSQYSRFLESIRPTGDQPGVDRKKKVTSRPVGMTYRRES